MAHDMDLRGSPAGQEQQFLMRSGEFTCAFKHVGRDDQDALKIKPIR